MFHLFFVPFRDKVMRMYDVANAGRSGTALCVLPQKSLTPKTLDLTISHRLFLANNVGVICGLFCDLLANFNYLIARSAVSTPAQSKIEFAAHFIKISTQITAKINCRKLKTPSVAATSFFAGEVEIYDFVTERAKRCIAAKRENGWMKFWEAHTMMGGDKNCLDFWFEILYTRRCCL